MINHAEAYVRGNVHTNSIENFWSLLKRGIKGTYVSVEPFHLFRYLDEQSFRFNTRKTERSGSLYVGALHDSREARGVQGTDRSNNALSVGNRLMINVRGRGKRRL